MLYVSLWYGKLPFLGLKMAVFPHFYTLNYHKNFNKPLMFVKGVSADTQRPKKDYFEILVHYFSVGV